MILVFSMVSMISHGTEESIEVSIESSENYSDQLESSGDIDFVDGNDEETDARSSDDEKLGGRLDTDQNACRDFSYERSAFSYDNEDSSSQRANVRDDYDHELIIDEYTISFEENLTALEAEATFDIHRIETEIDGVEDIYTADQIRENDTEDKDLIGDIEEDITDVFEETINDAFPKADKSFYPTESDPGEESDPIKIMTSADVYLVKESLGFDEDNEELDIDEMVSETLRIGGIIANQVNLTVEPGHDTTYLFEIPQPYLANLAELESEEDWGIEDYENEVSTSKNNSDGIDEVTLQKELRIRHEDPDEIEEEDIRVKGDFDLRDLGEIDLVLSYYLYDVDIEKYDEFDIPDNVENLDLIDAKFIERSIDNGLVEWKTIAGEMDDSIEDIEENMPEMMDEVNLTHSEDDRSYERIIRRYDERNFQPTITTDDVEVGIDNELGESLMNSGGIVDFEISEMDEEKYPDYSISMLLKTGEFMYLYDSASEKVEEEGDGYNEYYIEIDPIEGYEGDFRAHPDKEVPTNQHVNLETIIGLESADLTLDLTVSASTNIDGRTELYSIQATDDVEDDFPDYIEIEFLTSQFIRQIEKRDLLDKNRILNVTREGEGIDDFDGVEKALQDMLDKDEIEASTEFEHGTWEIPDEDTENQPIVLLIDSKFDLSLRNSQGANAFDIYSMEMGEFDIPAIEDVDTNFRLVFPSGIKANVEETEEVSTGETGSRFYIEIERSGDSEGDITISPEIVISLSVLFSTDVTLHGIPFLVITLAIIALIVLIIMVIYIRRKKKKGIEEKEGMRENVGPENAFERVEDSRDTPPPAERYQEGNGDGLDEPNSNFDESNNELEDHPPPPTSDSSDKTSKAEPSALQEQGR